MIQTQIQMILFIEEYKFKLNPFKAIGKIINQYCLKVSFLL